MKKLLVWFKWIELHLENARNDLTCCCICTKGCNKAKHRCPTIKLLCFRGHGKNEIWIKYKEELAIPWVFTHGIRLWELIVTIRKVYLIIEMICAECNLSSRSFFLAKWLFKLEELVLHLEARFNSDWCIAFLFAFCSSSRIFNSVELEWLGLEDRNNSALWSEVFLQRLFLIKGRWFITFLGRGNPVPCYLNMHFPEEIERAKSVAVDTILCDQVKYLILISLKKLPSALIG